jgi:dTDP-4-dehydrorhamnose reductase
MRLLVLGGTGMLGHQLVATASRQIETFSTVRGPGEGTVVGGVDALDFRTVEQAIDDVRPHAIVNCIGIVKQNPAAKDPAVCLTINALLPHRINEVTKRRGIRFIHISTDCVFDGRRGNYRETDLTNATDHYGKTKALGEVEDALTLRTSIIGRELSSRQGLVEWFLANCDQPLKGYTHAKFSGLTTIELSRVIVDLLLKRPSLSGLYHVASGPIDKFSLLFLLNDAFGAKAVIEPDDKVRIDRTLNGSLFQQSVGYSAPSWQAMVSELAESQNLIKERMHA